MKIKYLTTILIAIAGLAPSAWAVTYLGEQTPGYAAHYTAPSDTYLVGTVIPGLQGNGGQINRDVLMTNNLLHAGTGQHFVGSDGSVYSNTGLFNGPDATATGAVTNQMLGISFPNGMTGPVTINLDTAGTFTYLVVAYDGTQSGVAVWNIAGLTGTIQFDAYGGVESGSGLNNLTGNLLGANESTQGTRKITSFTLLNPTGGVPDGGTTVMLLGAALSTLGVARRFFLKS